MIDKEVAKVYAGALLEIGVKKNLLSQYEEELRFLKDLLKDDKEFALFLNAPVISKESKKTLVDKIFTGKLSDDVIHFVNILINNDRQQLIAEVYQYLMNSIDETNKTQRVKVISSIKLGKETLEKIGKLLSTKIGKKIIIEEEIDAKIVGGVILKVGDKLIDGSIIKNIKKIHKKLIDSKVGSELAYED